MAASGIVLAGGQSRRMGRDKAWIEFRGRPLVEWVLKALGAVCNDLIIVANDQRYASLGAKLVSDQWPGGGSLGGIYSGLSAAANPYSVLVGCDMPFLNPALLRYMLDQAPGFDVVIPSAPDKSKPVPSAGPTPTAKDRDLHPLHAVYSRDCLVAIRSALERGDLRMISFHDAVRVRVVSADEIERFDPLHLSFYNLNTPNDLARAEALGSSRSE